MTELMASFMFWSNIGSIVGSSSGNIISSSGVEVSLSTGIMDFLVNSSPLRYEDDVITD